MSPPDLPDPKIHYKPFGELLAAISSGLRFQAITPRHIEEQTLPSYPQRSSMVSLSEQCNTEGILYSCLVYNAFNLIKSSAARRLHKIEDLCTNSFPALSQTLHWPLQIYDSYCISCLGILLQTTLCALKAACASCLK